MTEGAARSAPRILVADDHANFATSVSLLLRDAGFEVVTAVGGDVALRRLDESRFDVVVADLRLDRLPMRDLLRRALERSRLTRVLLLSRPDDAPTAAAALDEGAEDFLFKPFSDEELLARIRKALGHAALMRRAESLAREAGLTPGWDAVVARSRAMSELVERLPSAARSDAGLLLAGERGTGRAFLARVVHANGRRRAGPFHSIDCRAWPDAMLATELFGEREPAGPGGRPTRRGLLADANGGTLLLESVDALSTATQARLLRALEGEPVGTGAQPPLDVRFVCTTDADLGALVAGGRFLEALARRLAVLTLHVPALRLRPDDVPALAQHFLNRFDRRHGTAHQFAPDALAVLSGHPFPGNVGELEHLVVRAASVVDGERIGRELLLPVPTPSQDVLEAAPTLAKARDDAERLAIRRALAETNGDLAAACRRLGVSSTTLWRRMVKLGLRRSEALEEPDHVPVPSRISKSTRKFQN